MWAPSCGSWWGRETWDGGRSPLKCFKFYLLAVSQGMLALSSQTRDGTHPCPLHWPYRALTTGPPGKSWKLTFLYLHFSVLGGVQQQCSFILSVLFSEWTDHTPSRTNILIFSHHLHPQDESPDCFQNRGAAAASSAVRKGYQGSGCCLGRLSIDLFLPSR